MCLYKGATAIVPSVTATAKRFTQAAIATPHYLASEAGLAELARGGNAVDAIVAANLVLGVVAPYYCGYGGDLFAIVWDGALNGYLGSGRSPASASLEAVRDRHGNDAIVVGPQSVTVPGAVAGWFDLLERWGTRTFGDLADDAIRHARDGFELSVFGGGACEMYAPLYAEFDEWQAVYGASHPGEVLHQPALATLIEHLAAHGPTDYYQGSIASSIVRTLHEHGGLMEVSDLSTHAGEWCEPLLANYRGTQVAQLPPPTQGVSALEILRILEGFDFDTLDAVTRAHVMVEAVKLGLADRDAHVSDPQHMTAPPADLLADDFIAKRRAAIDLDLANNPITGHRQNGGTAYLCAADSDGLLVSLIQSNFLAFGSGVHVPKWGINLNNRGSSFSLDPSSVNVMAPSKLPMHTLIPSMVLTDRSPSLVFGTMGGDAQAQVHAQVLSAVIDDDADPQVAIDAPRWRVDVGDWTLRAEKGMDERVIDGLASRGHNVVRAPRHDSGMGHAHAIRVEAQGYAVATDPRAEGAALGL